jgi:hypothetical protein
MPNEESVSPLICIGVQAVFFILWWLLLKVLSPKLFPHYFSEQGRIERYKRIVHNGQRKFLGQAILLMMLGMSLHPLAYSDYCAVSAKLLLPPEAWQMVYAKRYASVGLYFQSFGWLFILCAAAWMMLCSSLLVNREELWDKILQKLEMEPVAPRSLFSFFSIKHNR